jgi:hypothetical protein
MVENVEKCGSVTIRYPSECAYTCWCGSYGCRWQVKCDGTVFNGEGFTPPKPPKHPHVTLAGDLVACAEALQKAWGRRVIVPKELRGRTIRKRAIRGTPEDIAHALGLELGSRLKGSRSTRKRQEVKIVV